MAEDRSGAGYWIIISTLITVVAPLFARYTESVLMKLLDKLPMYFSIERKWKNSVQLVSNTTITNFSARTRVGGAYKAVMYHLISKHGSVPLSHIRQQVLAEGHSDIDDETDDYLNRSFNFIATGYNKAVLLDETTHTYVIPTQEETTHRETVTTNNIINIVSNHVSATELLNMVSGYQIKYQEYIKRYNKEGQLKYIKLRIKDSVRDSAAELRSRSNSNTNSGAAEFCMETIKRNPVWDISDFTSSKTFLNVFFTDKDRILRQVDHFTAGEEFYRHRGIPWTLNILLYGVPGCGKTSFIKALSNKLQRHIIDVSLSAIKTTEDFRYVFNTEMFKDNYIPIDKRIIVLEDIDCMASDILSDRSKRVAPLPTDGGIDDQMNLSCFLNTLDGIHEQNGRIIIATTNCIDTLDPAVLRRFNVKVHFTYLTRELSKNIINNYYDYEVPLSDAWVPHNLTGASLTQLCMQFQDDPEMLVDTLMKEL
jgi:tRNA uridine 5-carbamoylmethylation protein Kti12